MVSCLQARSVGSAQAAAADVQSQRARSDKNPALLGGTKKAPQLSAEELFEVKVFAELTLEKYTPQGSNLKPPVS